VREPELAKLIRSFVEAPKADASKSGASKIDAPQLA